MIRITFWGYIRPYGYGKLVIGSKKVNVTFPYQKSGNDSTKSLNLEIVLA